MEDLGILFGGIFEAISHGDAVPVLVGPHAVQMEESDAVSVRESLIEVGLPSRHRREVPVDKSNSPFGCGNGKLRKKILQKASIGKFDLQIGSAVVFVSFGITRQRAIEPEVYA